MPTNKERNPNQGSNQNPNSPNQQKNSPSRDKDQDR